MNPLQALASYGQSVWLDYIQRSLITSGELQRLIQEDGVRGVTSNPAIFEKAIAGSTEYTAALDTLRQQHDDAMALYEGVAIDDIQDAADVLRSVYDATNGRDGFVSLEVSPYLAHNTNGTIAEAQRLWQAVDRNNLMIKVPATPEGIPAIQHLISEGININVTLLFAQEAYARVAEAYIAGLEALAARGGNVAQVASVASFFISRIDSAVDALLTARLKASTSASERAVLQDLLGKVAIANAKLTYQRYQELFAGPRWQRLAEKGAQTQRVLWASTSTKNPQYRDVMYVEELIGANTVNTMPPATVEAFRDHGQPRHSLVEDVDAARETMDALEKVGISMQEVTAQLLTDGVRLFAEAFDKLLNAVDARSARTATVTVSEQTFRLPQELAQEVTATLADWRVRGKVWQLWARDAALWTGTDESTWLGWLRITAEQLAKHQVLQDLAAEVRTAGFSHVLLLGMGGSSLGPEVLHMTFGRVDGFPAVHVLDSTDPAQIRAFAEKVDLAKTLFIVSSKSGSTLEPNIFKQYFYDRVSQVVGAEQAGKRFIAITDPGSKLQHDAEHDGFRHIFAGVPSIGGRYSVLSHFGMVPAAVMGLDTRRFLQLADDMAVACSPCMPIDKNPGVVLGTILGVLANHGRDKVTICTSPGLWDFGAWLEQLLAESTGKQGKGLVPVDREQIGAPEVYGRDRVFVYVRLQSAPDAAQDTAIAALEQAGQPVVRIAVSEAYRLGQEFFRWEIATAVAGAIMGINPFDQPDVEASKVATRKLTTAYEETGALPHETPLLVDQGLTLFADQHNAAVLTEAVGQHTTLVGYLRAHLQRLQAGDYCALLAYIAMNEAHEQQLQAIRHLIRDRRHVATCLGFGPRFLHSTGQAYKGGPNSGVFLQITCDDAADLQVPGQRYTFGVVKAAQARGDFEVLAERHRRALRVHVGADVLAGLATLDAAIRQALA
jgi:transaldolase/glucose-6-phosphate isomerase